jgi:hypothetical protein
MRRLVLALFLRGMIDSLVQGPAFGMRQDRSENPEDRSVMILFLRWH